MNEKRHRNRQRIRPIEPTNSTIESDEYFGFIVGYTSNGVPYGLTHEQWDGINSAIETRNANNDDLPF
jgi:hypothetical protein